MTTQELLSQLKRLEKISPDEAWLKGNRDLLLTQISNSGAEKLPAWKMVLINLSSLSRVSVRPASSFAIFALLLVTGAIFSQRLVAQAQPNESLYIARIISEQVRLNTTFNAVSRDKMALEFSANHAQDISRVLDNPDFNTEENREKVEKLNNSFKAEVENVKRGLNRLSVAAPTVAASPSEKINNLPINNEEEVLVMAESLREKTGLQLQENLSPATTTLSVPEADPTTISNTEVDPNMVAALEDAISDVSEIAAVDESSYEFDKMIAEIQDLFDAKEYKQVAEKLKAINKIIKK